MNNTKDTKSRKYQLTINNPEEKGYTHAVINEIMKPIKFIYYCLCDEIGEQGTPHTHIYFVCKNAVAFSRVKTLFAKAHIEVAHGTSQENRDYIRKEGKYADSDKKETNLIDTFEEYGVMPLDKSSKNETVSEIVLQMIEDGCSNAEIIRAYPSYMTKIQHLDKARQTLLDDEQKCSSRNLKVTYISGCSGINKTSDIAMEHGRSNIYEVPNYEHPFDGYQGEKVIIFKNFHSSLPLNDMLYYLDGSSCKLPARYIDKTACFTDVYITSDTPLNEQYTFVRREQPNIWNEFVSHIDDVKELYRNNNGEVEEISFFPEDYKIKEC